MLNFIAGVRPSSPAPSSRHLAISSQHLLGQARAHQAMGNIEEAKKSYSEAVNKAKIEHEKKPGDRQAKEAFDAIRNESFTFLSGLQEPATVATVEEHSPTSLTQKQLLPISRNGAATQRPLSAQRAHDASIALSNAIKPDFVEKRPSLCELGLVQTTTPTEEKNAQVEYLFEKALSTLSSLEVPNKPSLFLVYAHDNPFYGRAEAATSRYLIDKLSQIRVNLYSDQTPMGQTYLSSAEELKEDGKLEDILTNQLCLLPTRLRGDVKPVNKVVVCCSEVLGRYLEWSHYKDFYQALRDAYLKDYEQQGSLAIREVVEKFSQEQKYKAGFHHVLTEIAFLQIRAELWQDQHGIIPVSLTPNSYEHCLAHFIPATTVRIEDMPRLDAQTKAGEMYPNQSRHGVLFKLIERVLVSSDEAKTFLYKFWQGYSECISRLNKESSTPGELEFTKLVDSIFGDIEKTLRDQLVLATLQQHKDKVEKLRLPSLSKLRGALYGHYQRSNLSIQRVSGQTASLNDCYVNLAIVESQAQREKDKEELEKQAATFERLPSSEWLEATNPNKLIALEKLFEAQKLRNGSEAIPQRILIQGRAGIGKTTLCKKLVYDYQHHGLWQEQFDCLLWVPLRQLKTRSPKCLEELLCDQYLVTQGQRQALALADAFKTHQDKMLFILDGLDEVVEELNDDRPLRGFLQELINQKYILVTSRPAGVDAQLLGRLDLELETIGFSPENVRTYIEAYAPASDQEAIRAFIDRMPLIQSLVNIPIQLDALCYSWDTLPKDQASVTMSMLYEAMVDKLWRKDGIRLEKQDKGKTLASHIIQFSSKTKLEKLMSDEIDYLSYLAFKGLEAGKIEFSSDALDQYQAEFESQFLGKTLAFSFTDDLRKTSFLHTADAKQPEAKRYYHFLHLTFQEFFAAKFLVRHLQIYSKAVKSNLDVMHSQGQLEKFIDENKYNPRYVIVWWMVAGLLKDASLAYFFNLLERSPRDLIGMRHQHVMLGCLNEARSQLDSAIILRLEKEFTQWFSFEMKFKGYGASELGRRGAFPEHLPLTCLGRPEVSKKHVIQTLGARSILSEKAISALITALQDKEHDVRSEAGFVLKKQKVLSENHILALSATLQHKDLSSRFQAAYVLATQNKLSESAASCLMTALQSDSKDVRSSAIWALAALNKQPEIDDMYFENDDEVEDGESLDLEDTLSDAITLALITALQDEDHEIIDGISRALTGQKTLSENAILALIIVLQNGNERGKHIAACMLGSQAKKSEAALQALIAALHDKNSFFIRISVAHALGDQATESKTALQALIVALQDENSNVRKTVASELGKQKTLPENAILALLVALQDENNEVRTKAAWALAEQTTLSEDIISILIAALPDEDWLFRCGVAYALGQQKTASENAISALITALQDREWSVRSAAAKALGKQKILSENAISALIVALQDEDWHVRPEAAKALIKQKMQFESTNSVLLTALQDKNCSIRAEAAKELSTQKMLSENAISALTAALQDEYGDVRYAAVCALASQKTLSETAIPPLVDRLRDIDSDTRSKAAVALSLHTRLPNSAISALIDALWDRDREVRSEVANALMVQKELPETALSRLSDMVLDEKLVAQQTFSDPIVQNLVELVLSCKKNARPVAARALSRQTTLSVTAIQNLIKVLTDDDWDIKYWAARALELNLNQLYTILPVLEAERIETLYKSVLFDYSCKHIAPLYIQGNQLHFYTERGHGHTDQIQVEKIEKVTQAFEAVQIKEEIILMPSVKQGSL